MAAPAGAVHPIKFLLNQDSSEAPVGAPAFSITKVIGTAAVVLTPLTGLLVKAVGDVHFTAGQVVALVLGVLGLLAITSAADVLARALATAKQVGVANYFPLTPSIGARLTKNGPDVDVQLVAARGSEAGAEFLILEQGEPLRWVPRAQITIAS